jgi:hypothetical protein
MIGIKRHGMRGHNLSEDRKKAGTTHSLREARSDRGRSGALVVALLAIVVATLVGCELLERGAQPDPTDGMAAQASPSPVLSPRPASLETPALTNEPPATEQPGVSPEASPSARRSPDPEGPDYLLMSRARLQSLPTTGSAWAAIKEVADGDLGRADLTDQDNYHGVRTLAVALVYARTGDPAYAEKAQRAIVEVIGTEERGSSNSILALGRQLAGYVLAADLIELSGADDEEFRVWLDRMRTVDLGGHGRWRELTATHEDSINNWGAYAGASRIAASLYLGDHSDVVRASQVLRGFLGERWAWSDWQQPQGNDLDWVCDVDEFTPINPPCVRQDIDLDGAIVADISRSGGLRWPPGRSGRLYTLESLQGLSLQAELLHMAGYNAWEWGNRGLLRAARFLERAGGWNEHRVHFHVAWLVNERYRLQIPTRPASFGRAFGYTDWLYGDGP